MIVKDQAEDVVVVATASNYPPGLDAPALWDTVLHQHRAFRDIPPGRIPVADYAPAISGDADAFSITSAGLIQGWAFDPQGFHIPKDQVAVTDTAHWLALDTAVRLIGSLCGSGYELDRTRTGVVLGNSLTGETSRALALRLRWPYVRRAVLAAQARTGHGPDPDFLAELENAFKGPLAEPTTDSLAGGLSNTISGRIMNHLDLRGPNFTVDAACASSLLSVIQVAAMLQAGVIDVGVAGGVDVSIDPFELVGFSRLGAMATGEMRIYDEHPTGFIPGEGCGLVALMRRADADRAGLPVLAVIAGAGMASDGQGGLTRPTEAGHLAAARAAYAQAQISPGLVGLFEGHGTGTAIGDQTEVSVLAGLREGHPHAAAIGSVKANIGHTKAAAGVAGLIKSVKAVEEGVLPPTTGTRRPLPVLRECGTLRILHEPEVWDAPVRVAGVSALGFGGINTHVVVRQGTASASRHVPRTTGVGAHALLVLTGRAPGEILDRITSLRQRSRWFSDQECVAASAGLTREADLTLAVRVAVPVDGRVALRRGLDDAASVLADADGVSPLLHVGVASVGVGVHRVGLLFPGQGAPIPRRPPPIRAAVDFADLVRIDPVIAWTSQDPRTSTEVAQPAIVASALLGQAWLGLLGCKPVGAVGHSLGEIAAICWAGGMTLEAALELATVRGRVMDQLAELGTGMVSIAAGPATTQELIYALHADPAPVIAAFNGPDQVTVAGTDDVLADLVELARRRSVPARRLPVSHAFHSPAMGPVLPAFEAALRQITFTPTTRPYLSTVTGDVVDAGAPPDGLRDLLTRQLLDPVRFDDAVRGLAGRADLLVEVGPGTSMSVLTDRITTVPTVATDLSGDMTALVRTVAALVAAGHVSDLSRWSDLTGASTVTFDHEPVLLTNPCGTATAGEEVVPRVPVAGAVRPEPPESPTGAGMPTGTGAPGSGAQSTPPANTVLLDRPGSGTGTTETSVETILGLLRTDIADTTGLDLPAQVHDLRFSADLHLNSLQVNQVVARVATGVGRDLPADPLSLADATLGQTAELIGALPAGADDPAQWNPGDWVHAFVDSWAPVEEARPDPGPDRDRVVVRLPGPVTPESVLELRDAASTGADLLVLHEGVGLGAARALFSERHDPQQCWTMVQVDPDVPVMPAQVPHARPGDFEDLTRVGGTWQQRVSGRHVGSPRPVPGRTDQVTLVTGGVAGITAECAAELAHHDGSRLLFLGRTPPRSDRVREPLRALRGQGLRAEYRRVDLTDPALVATILADVAGRVTAIIHGAAMNEPRAASAVDLAALHAADAVKADALRVLLGLVGPQNLAWLVSFGSIIERCGLEGQLSYAHANDVLRSVVEEHAGLVPGHALHLQWSVWSGVGMGVGLGVLDGLARRGVSPISPDVGRARFWDALATDGPVTRLITGRYPPVPTRVLPTAAVPAGRYVEAVSAHVPGTELVTSCELSVPTDRALAHHQIAGLAVLPAVCVLEAAAQATTALHPTRSWRSFTNVDLVRAVALAPGERVTLQVAALDLAGNGQIQVRVRTGNADIASAQLQPTPQAPDTWSPGSFTGTDNALYGTLFFHDGPFRRVVLRSVSASTITAEVDTAPSTWFSAFLDQQLHLGDPGVLDASIHALQACFPQRQLLPVRAEHFTVHNPSPPGPCTLVGTERPGMADNGDLTFDVRLVDRDGVPVLDWGGLVLRRTHAIPGVVAVPLLGPAFARTVRDLGLDRTLDMIVTSSDVEVSEALRILGSTVTRQPGGRITRAGGGGASTTCSGGHRLSAVSQGHQIGVDWEIGTVAPTVNGYTGAAANCIADATGLPLSTASRLAWVAAEAVKKAGGSLSPLDPARADNPALPGVVLTGPTHAVYACLLTTSGAEGDKVTAAVAVRR